MTEWDQLHMDSSDVLEPVAKNQKRRLEQDRISQLPDSILRLIFTYLTTRDAVQSSVLSKRWRNLWASMQRLDFHSRGFKGSSVFSRFIDTVLLLRDQLDVHEFRLNFSICEDSDEDNAKMWIRYAVKHNVRVLHLTIYRSNYNHIRLPHCLFTCPSLEALTLHVSILPFKYFCSTRFPDFGRIKKLDLGSVIFYDNFEKLLSGCPVIEDLRLRNCTFESDSDSGVVCIISQTMKSLWIENCVVCSEVIRISIPSLRALHYVNSCIGLTSLENLSSLVHAFISDYSFNEYELDSSAINIIKGLSNAKILKLYGRWIEFVPEEKLSEFPAFWNLRSLKMGEWCFSDNFQPVAYFLRNSPNLEKLTLKQTSRLRCQFLYVNKESDKLSFNCPRLKIIKIQCDKLKRARELVGILLENSRISQSIMITHKKYLLRDLREDEEEKCKQWSKNYYKEEEYKQWRIYY